MLSKIKNLILSKFKPGLLYSKYPKKPKMDVFSTNFSKFRSFAFKFRKVYK
jgi:hypothetical protein